MAEYTTHYNLKKPAKNENYNIDVANQNNDIIDEKLYGKVDKKAGKDLSTNDFTNEYKKKLDTLKNYDDAEVIKQITSFNERVGKVEEANTEISKNVEALKTDNESNKTAISELKETTAQNSETITAIQEEQTTQNENIEKNAEGIAQNKKDVDEELTKIEKENSLLKSQIPTGTASGNSIHLEDSSNMPFEWKLRGGSRQATRSGYNLANLDADSFVKNGVTVTNNGDGSWTFNGTSSSFNDLILTKNFLLNHKIYQFEDAKYLFKTIVVSGSFSNPDEVVVRTMGMGQDDGVDNFLILNNELRDGEFSKIFNKKSTSHLSRFELYCGPNVTFNNYTIKILFAKTDNNELEWEQYGVSPSPDFPSEIKNVGDDVKIVIRNKNFCDLDILENIKGKAITINNRNSFTINLGTGEIGIATGTNIMLPNDIDKNKKYRIKYHRTMNNTTFLPYIKVLYADGSMDGVNDINLDADYEYVTKGAEISSITIAWNTQSQGGIVTFSNISITEADEDNDFEESKKEEIIFPLAEGQKLYEGSYLAEDGIHNTRTQIKLLSSDDNFFVSALGTYQVFGRTQKGIKQGSRLLSNYFKDYDSVNAIKDRVGIANNNSIDRIYVSNGISTTLDEFKDWLNKCENAGRPVIVEYELATEEIIPYTTEQQAVIDKILYTYKNVTNISVDNKLATLDITYKKDIETMFNNQAKEYNERLSNIENLLNTTETSALLLDNLENDLEKEV